MSMSTPLSPEVNNSAAWGDFIEHPPANTGPSLEHFDAVAPFFGFPCRNQARETGANDSYVNLIYALLVNLARIKATGKIPVIAFDDWLQAGRLTRMRRTYPVGVNLSGSCGLDFFAMAHR